MPPLDVIGFTGMDASTHYGNRDPHKAWALFNCYPAHTGGPAPLVVRPGFMGQAMNTATAKPQGMLEMVNNSGARGIIAVAGGELYWHEASTSGTFSRLITTADLAAASITLSATAPVHIVEYNRQAIFADNTNQPFMWSGASGAGLTLLSNAPAATVGKPTVYYGKLFFIKSGNTIVWSEENAANTGYEAGGYNNSWDLNQTGNEPLKAIQGTNLALYYWRAKGIGLIEGAVTPDFSSTGTDDGISTQIGTEAAGSVSFDGEQVFFMDRERRPYVIRGTALRDLSFPLRSLWLTRIARFKDQASFAGTIDSTVNNSATFTLQHPITNHVLFFWPRAVSGTIPLARVAFAYDRTTLALAGIWTLDTTVQITCGCIATHYIGADVPSLGLCVGTDQVTTTSVVGFSSLHTYGVADTIAVSGGALTTEFPFVRIVTGPAGWQSGSRLAVDRCDVVANIVEAAPETNKLAVSCRVLTPDAGRDTNTNAAYPVHYIAARSYLKNSQTALNDERRFSFGQSAEGRWLAADILLNMYQSNGTTEIALPKVELHGVSFAVRRITETVEDR